MRSTFGSLRSRLRMSSPRRPRLRRSLSRDVGDGLQLGDHELRHDQLVVEHLGLDDVGDPAVDHHAGVEHVRLEPFDFLGELDVGNDEAEVVLGLQQQADAGVAQHHAQHELQPIGDAATCRAARRSSASRNT